MASTPHPPPKPEPPKPPAARKAAPDEYATIGDEQRARSAEMEAAGGPEAWMKASAGEPQSKVVPGVAAHEKR